MIKKFNYSTIDMLRGFAATTVFLNHYGVSSILKKLFKINSADIIESIGASYAVPLFFLISGFCIHLSQLKQNAFSGDTKLNLSTYLKRRFWRIYPCYLIILLFACAVGAINGEKISVVDFFVHVFVCQGFSVKYFNSINLVLWTISVEMLFYLLYPIWYFLRRKFGLHQALIISFLISITSWTVIILRYDVSILPTRYFILNIWGAWCFGAWLCEEIVVNEKKFLNDKIWWLVGFGLFIAFWFLSEYNWAGQITYNISIVLWAWVVVPFLSLEGKVATNNNRIINFMIKAMVTVGLSSYSLYMIHEPFMFLRNAILKSIVSENIRLLVGGFWLIATFLAAWGSYQLFEKPFLSYRSSRK